MAGPSMSVENRLIDALAIVHDSQPKLALVIADCHVDPPSLGVTKRVAQRLARDVVNLIPDDRREAPRFSFYAQAKLGTVRVVLSVTSPCAKAVTSRARSLDSTVEERSPCTASRHSVIACLA